MEIVDISGWIAFLTTITYTSFGLPVQIYKNYTTRSVKGLSLSMMVMLFLAFSSWVVYGLVKFPHDWYIVGSNSVGLVSVAVILLQFWFYRSSAQSSDPA